MLKVKGAEYAADTPAYKLKNYKRILTIETHI
jgi:hypothetical protein